MLVMIISLFIRKGAWKMNSTISHQIFSHLLLDLFEKGKIIRLMASQRLLFLFLPLSNGCRLWHHCRILIVGIDLVYLFCFFTIKLFFFPISKKIPSNLHNRFLCLFCLDQFLPKTKIFAITK